MTTSGKRLGIFMDHRASKCGLTVDHRPSDDNLREKPGYFVNLYPSLYEHQNLRILGFHCGLSRLWH